MDLIKEFPWTAVIGFLIAVVSITIKHLFDVYVVPYLESKNLIEAAKVAVNAAEAMFGRYKGEEKLKYALKLLEDQGWNVDTDIVLAALRSAWQELDLKQIEAGVKEPAAA